MDDFAAQIAALDLVITIDNSTAHLAGALGVPVWLLLPFAADWRWLDAGEHSPWYPTMRLFRQPKLRDWPSVLENVEQALSLKVT
jgi:ADP-heptose:LPS heptosyltransferase